MTFTQPRVLTLAIMAATLGLTACNSNDDDGSLPGAAVTMKTVTIVPSLGKISNARVVLRNAANRSQKLGDKPLLGDGSVSFAIPANIPLVVAELEPTGATRYFDEGVPDVLATPANESLQPFPLTQKLRVAFAVSGNGQRVGMTPFTEAALVRAEALAGAQALNATLIAQANAFVQQVFGISNILQAPLVIGSKEDYLKLLEAGGNAAAREYAMRLASLAQQARNGLPADTPSPAVVMMQALSADLSDGKLDRAGAGLPANLPYSDISGFANAWIAAMTALVNQIIAAIGNGEGGLTAAQIQQLTQLFNGLQAKININPVPVIADAVPVRVVSGIAEYACADRNRVKSLNSNNRLDIDFVNQSGKTLKIDWINNLGQAVNYKTGLANGATYAQSSTYVTHPWLITDSAGQCQGIFAATTTTKKTITLNANGVATLAEAGGVLPGPTCISQGSDNTVGFSGAPNDFCGFTRASSSMITAPDSFTFVSADADKRYLKVDVVNNVPQRVQVENSAYSFSCGGGNPACANIVFTTNGNIRQFNFTNTVLTADNGSGKTLTLKDGNVIHQIQGGVNQPLRTENGVEFYDCATWKLIPNGAATSNVSLNFINQRGNFKSITINGLSSINRSVLLFGNLQNGGTRTQAGLHNQMVMVDDSAGTCLAVLKPVTAGDKNVTFNADDSVSVSSVVAPPPAGVTITLNENACSGGIPTLRQNCGVTTTNDFSINNLKTVNGGTDCTLTKNGGNVTVNLNGKSITASLNAEAGDSLSALAGGDRLIVANTSGTSVSYRVNAAGTLVHSEVTSLTDAVIAEKCTF